MDETRWAILRLLVDTARGRGASSQVDEAAEGIERWPGGGEEGDVVWAYSRGLRGLAEALRWEPAVMAATPDADLHRRAAALIGQRALQTRRVNHWPDRLVAGLDGLSQLNDYDEVRQIAVALAGAPLPPRVLSRTDSAASPATSETPVAVPVTVTLEVAGRPIKTLHWVQRNVVVPTVARIGPTSWPEGAQRLRLGWQSAFDGSVIHRTEIVIEQGSREGRGSLVVRAEFGAAVPGELTLQAEFEMADGTRVAARPVGPRIVRLITPGAAVADLVDLPDECKSIVGIVELLRQKLPDLPVSDLKDLELLLVATVRYAQRALDRDLTETPVSEHAFQKTMRAHLRNFRGIGERLQEGAEQAGGETDLKLGRVVDELKFEDVHAVPVAAAPGYSRQPTIYGGAVGCPVSIVTVCDASPKTEPRGSMANHMAVFPVAVHGAPVPTIPSYAVAIVVPVGFAVPSSFSPSSLPRPRPPKTGPHGT